MTRPYLSFIRFTSGFTTALFALLLTAQTINGQDLNKEVFVVRSYEPTLSDAVKINFLPDNNSIEFATPKFNYTITPKPLENGYEPEPIKAARTIATSLPKIYNSWLKVGLGNYTTSLAELNVSNVRSREYAYGIYLYHRSSSGDLRLYNDMKVPAGYADNTARLYGRRFYPKAKLTGDLRFNHHGFNYYGYNTEIYRDSLPRLSEDSTHMQRYKLGFDAGLSSTFTDSSHLNYRLNVSYDYFWDKLKNKENHVLVRTGFSKYFNGLQAGFDLSLDHSLSESGFDTVSTTLVKLSPWISKRTKDWRFLLGFESAADIGDITRYYFYPHATLDIIIIEKILVPFLGLSGELHKNTYMDLADENPYIESGLHLKNTSSNLIAYGGLRGSISAAIRFKADVTYTVYKNLHFFVIDTLQPAENQFTGVYDDADLVTYHGQLSIQASPALNITLDGKYFNYKTYAQVKAWEKPDFRASFDALWSPRGKVDLEGQFGVIGTRWVRDRLQPDGRAKILPVADVNLRFNYNYSKAFTLFANIYNLADRSYVLWNQYPSQRFNFLFGLSYKL